MNCPECSSQMVKWEQTFVTDDLPFVVSLEGYYCLPCRRIFLNVDMSNFNGYIWKDLKNHLVDMCNFGGFIWEAVESDFEKRKQPILY